MTSSRPRCLLCAASILALAAAAPALAQDATVPATSAIYDPLGGPDLRNPQRSDLAQCSLWYGGPAGTLTQPGQTPPPVPPAGLHGQVSAGVSSACKRAEALTSLSAHANGVFVRAMNYLETASGYTDPNGGAVRYGYNRAVYGGGFGLTAPDGSFLSFDVNRAERHNVPYAGAPLDTRHFDATTYAMRGRAVLDAGMLEAVRVAATFTEFDRENDNFSYRALVGQPTVARFNRQVTRADVTGEWRAFGGDWTTGVDLRRDARDATRYQQAALVAQSRVMPDAAVTQLGFNVDGAWRPSAVSRIKFGARLEAVEATAGAIDATGLVTPGYGATPTPRALYGQYYGYTGDGTEREFNVSGKLRYEHDFDGGAGQWFAAGRRHVRTADPRERYFVSFTPPSGSALEPGPIHRTWIGNPGLAPEQHHLGEIGAGWSRGGWKLAVRGYADRATDFILHDRARGQAGILLANNANVFRNVDAFIAGIETFAGYRFGGGWFVNNTLHWTYGQNLTDGSAIAQIPALESNLRFGWSDDVWSAEGRVRMVATQTRIDGYFRTGSGDDGNGLGAVPGGFTTVDVMFGWKPRPNLTLTAGVENLFDRAYTEFVDRNDIDDPFTFNPLAAGRSFVVRGSARF